MKKYFGIIVTLALIFTLAFSISCTKEDTNGPVITIIGDNPLIVILNQNWTDPGASAEDDEDGVVAVTATHDVNKNHQSTTYKITYSATDAAGNTSTANRNVHVLNDASMYEGNYDATIRLNGNIDYQYVEIIESDDFINNKITFQKFDGHDPNKIYGNIIGTAITIPLQNSTINTEVWSFQGNGLINDTIMEFVIDYTATVNSAAEDYELTLVKQ
ncbi:immunoglobulin-like domain-containing protein [Bacteroidota bacterium]